MSDEVTGCSSAIFSLLCVSPLWVSLVRRRPTISLSCACITTIRLILEKSSLSLVCEKFPDWLPVPLLTYWRILLEVQLKSTVRLDATTKSLIERGLKKKRNVSFCHIGEWGRCWNVRESGLEMLDTVPLYCGEEMELDLKGTKVMLLGLVSLVSE